MRQLGLQQQGRAQGHAVPAGLLDKVRATMGGQLGEDNVQRTVTGRAPPGTKEQWSGDICRALLGSPTGLERGVATELAGKSLHLGGPGQ